MSTNIVALNNKIWSLSGVLRDDGISDSDYLEQLTYMLFLKMVDEYNRPPHNRNITLPNGVSWTDLVSKKGEELENYYVWVLETLSNSAGVLGEIYTKAVNKITTPVKLKQVIGIVDGETWTSMSKDAGDIYEGLLKKVSEDTKSGAGQYFTPRPIINTMVKCLRPEPGKTIVDPACGSGGFLLSAKDYILDNNQLNVAQQKALKFDTFYGWEIDIKVYRQCLMNLFLHNVGDLDGEHTPGITRNDALLQEPSKYFDYCLANPPFGTKSTTKISAEGESGDDETYNRQDFWVTGKNKQLNFVQHINSILKTTGKAAVVVPDNVLFEGGAGETVRKKLLETCDLHTILRLSKGMFYAQGVQANVIFFDKKPAG
jgi:type I restriction enzyme M protein